MLPKYLQNSGQDIRIDVLLLLPDMGDCISYTSNSHVFSCINHKRTSIPGIEGGKQDFIMGNTIYRAVEYQPFNITIEQYTDDVSISWHLVLIHSI